MTPGNQTKKIKACTNHERGCTITRKSEQRTVGLYTLYCIWEGNLHALCLPTTTCTAEEDEKET